MSNEEHITWASRQSRQKLLDKIAQNINYFATGEYRELANFIFDKSPQILE